MVEFISLDDVVVFFFNEGLEGPVTDGTHGVVGDSRDEDGEELILTGLDDEALVVLGAGENLRHGMFALNTIGLKRYGELLHFRSNSFKL